MEQAGLFLLAHSVASVGEAYMVRGRFEESLDGKNTSVGHGLERVARQVPEDLADLIGVADQHIAGRCEAQLNAMVLVHFGAIAQQLDILAQQLANIEAAVGAVARASEAQETLDRPIETLALFEHDVEQLTLPGLKAGARREHLHRTRDRRQRIADLVGQPGRQRADCGHAFLELYLLLELSPGRQILEDDNKAAVRAASVGER